ncbi:MAG: hypothetical protein QHH27_03320 [Clostridia bacterium]|nr:hypothetical protein [Clostridia bacterium]MDH7572567.1 hypothetical protein [Clostridia bacterium]
MEESILNKLDRLYPSARDAVKQAIEDKMEEMIRRGALHSGIAMKAYAETGMTALQAEIMGLLEKVAALKPGIADWQHVRSSIEQFVDSESKRLYTDACRRWDPGKYPMEEVKRILDDLQRKALTEVDMFVESRIKEIKEERSRRLKATVWDIVKVVAGGLIGYVLARFT